MTTPNEDLTQSGDVGVRWQAQMEEHLRDARGAAHEACLHGIDPQQAMTRAAVAQAHASAALALAIANGLGDIEVTFTKGFDQIIEAVQEAGGS